MFIALLVLKLEHTVSGLKQGSSRTQELQKCKSTETKYPQSYKSFSSFWFTEVFSQKEINLQVLQTRSLSKLDPKIKERWQPPKRQLQHISKGHQAMGSNKETKRQTRGRVKSGKFSFNFLAATLQLIGEPEKRAKKLNTTQAPPI